jgi:hypothetical protein
MNPHSPIKQGIKGGLLLKRKGVQIPQGGVWINQLALSNKPWQERTRQCKHVIQHNKQWQEKTL